MSKTVDEYIIRNKQWQEELIYLRGLLATSELQETIKWGFPVYTLDNKNVVGLGAFKSYFGLWFFQGVFLKDVKNRLVTADGSAQGMRQWRFNSFDEIEEDLVLAYIQEAIDNQKAGKMIKPQKKEIVMPEELQAALDEDAILYEAFEAFSHSKKREFAEHILNAKRVETKKARLEKMKPLILAGVGLHDRYRK
ncbi:YdeI/OmpD-associated family protein [Reichenbachiella ulvae]|uniref:YdeI/OmpD-associated family protein n=1 Tax=Reichenbachiella ulvae TaxID=2980104 RepID=A0ABT3D0E6_9BACT|nr:DUF1801 domain-containing protein [Reichenbachiella ulvae]MCV9389421.1 YdeI/OmpD-associated family protein [Reichenbachiella ulvae]